jgi:hypothetical protein
MMVMLQIYEMCQARLHAKEESGRGARLQGMTAFFGAAKSWKV